MDIDKLREQIAKRAAEHDKHLPKAAEPGKAVDDAAPEPVAAGSGAAPAFYRTLHARIARIEATLKPTERVELTHDVPDGHCYVEQLGYHGEDMLVFSGHLASGHRCTVFIHVHAVNLCLTVAPVAAGDSHHRIVFSGDAD